jgi:hypothetical protein
MDHYQYDYYYIIKTRAYHLFGLTELFMQHCQLPNLMPHKHLRALMDELAVAMELASNTTKGKRLFKFLVQKIDNLLHPAPPNKEQRLAKKTISNTQRRTKGN